MIIQSWLRPPLETACRHDRLCLWWPKVFLFLVSLFLCVSPQEVLAVDNETVTVGAPCGPSATPKTSATANATDWDTIMQCSGGTWKRAAYVLGSGATCDTAHAGQIQWTGTAFQGCDGTNWISLGEGDAPITWF